MFTAPLSPLFYPARSIINPSYRTNHRLSGHGDFSDLSSTFYTPELSVFESGERRGFTTPPLTGAPIPGFPAGVSSGSRINIDRSMSPNLRLCLVKAGPGRALVKISAVFSFVGQ